MQRTAFQDEESPKKADPRERKIYKTVIEGDSDFRDPRSASENKVKNAASLRWYQSLSLEDSLSPA